MTKQPFVEYRGQRFYLQSTRRYYQSGRKADPERLLHRRVWTDERGPIPDGMVVHHINGDWHDNRIENLEIMPRGEHVRGHWEEWRKDPELMGRHRANLDSVRHLAAAWQGSDAGRAMHSAASLHSWEQGRAKKPATCSVCGKAFESVFAERSDYCGASCRHRACYLRSHDSERTCAHCGKPFVANRYRTTKCCSRDCANKRRAACDPAAAEL
jgi:hypothetical protein